MRKLVAVVLVVLALLVVAVAAYWLSNRAPTESVHHGAPLLPASAAPWPAFQGGGPLNGGAGPLPSDRLLLRWEYTLASATKSSPVIAAGKVYVGDASGTVHALELISGRLLWKYKSAAEIRGAPLWLDENLYLGDTAGNLTALSAATGSVLWTFKADADIVGSPNSAGQSIIFGSYDALVYCLDARSGRQVWSFKTGAQVHATPAVHDGVIYCGGCDATLRAIALETGVEKWQAQMQAPIPTSPIVFGSSVAAGDLAGTVACFSTVDGSALWKRQIEGESMYGSFAYSGGRLFVPGRNKGFYCLSADDGQVLWSFPSRAGFEAAAVVAAKRALACGKDATMRLLDTETGNEVCSFHAGDALEGSPALAYGNIVFSDTAGTLYCLAVESNPALGAKVNQ